MPLFPIQKNNLIALARQIAEGIAANPADYPVPPFNATTLQTLLTAQEALAETRRQLEAELRIAVKAEVAGLDEIAEAAKRQLRLAEALHRADPVKLVSIGWSKRAEKKSNPPGQPRALQSQDEGPGTVTLKWKPPAPRTGGKPSFYRIERQITDPATHQVTEDFGQWHDESTQTQKQLTHQPRQAELAYRIVAINHTGPSTPSNTVIVVL